MSRPLAAHPFGAFREAGPGGEHAGSDSELAAAAQRPLAGTWFDEIAVVYRLCRDVGLANPRDVDELELWEIGSILGRNDPPSDEDEDDAEPQFNLNERPNPDGPSIFTAWRAMKIAEGKEPPAFGDQISKAEYDRVVKSIMGGRKGAGGG